MYVIDSNNVAVLGNAIGLDEHRAWGSAWEDLAYNSSNATLVDVPDPEGFVPGEFTYLNGVFIPSPAIAAQLLAQHKLAAVLKIDADVDQVYAAAIGNRGPEYVDAEQAATAYINAGYTGTVPAMVQSWATAKAWTAAQAADDIIAAAASLNGAKQAIRAARLLRKEQVRNAVNEAELSAAMTLWTGFVAAIRGQLGL